MTQVLSEQLRSIDRLRKMRLAGTTLHTKDNLPTNDYNCLLVHFFLLTKVCNSSSSSCFLVSGSLATFIAESNSIPKYVKQVVGAFNFLLFHGGSYELQTDNIASILFVQDGLSLGPAVKKSSR